MAALTAAGALIRIPTGIVPVTLQTLIVPIAGGTLGPRYGPLSQVIYLALGLAGLPVFAGGASGPAAVLSPTFGYLLGFPLAAWIMGQCGVRYPRSGYGYVLASAVAGLAAIYALGVLHLLLHLNYVVGKPTSLLTALGVGVLPFVPFDLVKCFIAAWIVMGIRRRVGFIWAR